ncbi:hypothetical protein T265_11812 [Opisthorchis viverrini]|uniref:Uncharacterized protein n=1 Tax=Opisthorchis viverrini TaxID=6198 RepID=A0A074YX75_OPIVI|nr:hypothetical protein T265_11812 [Opisthorchis viverrini]KER19406.1 hypothetical protein T265_11812 [Opisthorchis viverrini]
MCSLSGYFLYKALCSHQQPQSVGADIDVSLASATSLQTVTIPNWNELAASRTPAGIEQKQLTCASTTCPIETSLLPATTQTKPADVDRTSA